MKNKHIVIGVTGSIAAYKAAEITSQLKQKGCDIYVIMTKNAMEFVGPATFRSLTGNIVLTEMFPKDNTFSPTLHISLAEWMDVLVIVPATANIIGKIAHGVADDLLSTTALSTQKPILIAPAMNEKMYINPAVQENLKILKKRNCKIVEPETGFLACGYTGKGRLAGIDKIIKEIEEII
jgi:phosphopantothenoylcysteine decarboxylase/phosphopantothenate--cysteine ligase